MKRPRDVIGYRGVGRFGAAITGKQDLSSVIRSTLHENLTRMGFASTVALSTGTQLRVEIRSLEHSVIPGLFAGNVEADAALKANCLINKAPEYEKLYRGSFREQVVVIQFAENNQRHINTALSEAVQSMLDDQELLSCLTGTSRVQPGLK
jgi:uncharacterized lipoprotein YajG